MASHYPDMCDGGNLTRRLAHSRGVSRCPPQLASANWSDGNGGEWGESEGHAGWVMLLSVSHLAMGLLAVASEGDQG